MKDDSDGDKEQKEAAFVSGYEAFSYYIVNSDLYNGVCDELFCVEGASAVADYTKIRAVNRISESATTV